MEGFFDFSVILLFIASAAGLLLGQSGKLSFLKRPLGNPKRVQSVSMMGLGLSAMGFAFIFGGNNIYVFWVFIISGLLGIIAGFVLRSRSNP
jgi:hypothetical protein